jgi:hypothetical protein
MTAAVRNESQMAQAVAQHVANSAREVRVGDCVFDVVGYDKRLQLFKLVECKLGSQSTTIGKTFGQIAAYCAVLSTRGRDFVEAFNEKVHLPFSQLMEATNNAKRIQVAFYVALTHDACKQQIELIRAVKDLLPLVGIIRVKLNGQCKDYVWNGGKDWKLAKAIPTVIKISQNGN